VIRKAKKKLKKIRWPKNFDKANPGPQPDAERWVHKLERVRGRKKGYMTATQGSSNVNTTATRNTFQTGPSTAHIDAVTAATKPNPKKAKKK
jgi:signal recognition particle subunit SRP72